MARDRETRRGTTALARQWNASDLTRATFARRTASRLAAFKYWRRQMRREAQRVKPVASAQCSYSLSRPSVRMAAWRRSCQVASV